MYQCIIYFIKYIEENNKKNGETLFYVAWITPEYRI